MNNAQQLHRSTIALVLLFILISSSLVYGMQSEENALYLPFVVKDFDTSWQFYDPIKVQLQPVPLSSPYLVIDSSERPHILWETYSSEKAFIYHTYLTDQGWTTPTPIANTLGRSKLHTPPVVGSHNDIYFVWYNELNLGGPYRIMYAAWDGTQWGPEYELIGQGSSIYIRGMTRLDKQGIPTVAFIDTDGAFSSNVYYQRWNGTGFSNREWIKKPSYASLIGLDTSNGVRFFGDDYLNGSIRYSLWKEGQFVVDNRSIPGKISPRSTFLDGTNNLHLYRSASVPVPGGNVTGIYHQCLKNDFSWSPEVVLSGEAYIQKYVVAFDEEVNPLIAWSTNNNQTLNLTIWNGCSLVKQRALSLPSLPDSYGWGEFVTVARNAKTGKVCFLSKEKYSSTSFVLTCTP